MYRTVVIGRPRGPEGRDALALAGLLASPGGRLVAVTVAPAGSLPAVDADGVPAHVAIERRLVAGGSAAHALHATAEEVEADLVVVGSTRRGTLGRVLLGTTAATLLQAAPCAVAVAPRGYADDATDRLRIVGVGYDGSREAELALAAADTLARERGATLRVVWVLEPLPPGGGFSYGYGEAAAGAREASAAEELEAALERLQPDVRPLGIKRHGDPATVLADEAERGTDLLVVGSRGYGPLQSALLGGVSAKLMRLAPCPVLVVPRGGTATAEVVEEAAPTQVTR